MPKEIMELYAKELQEYLTNRYPYLMLDRVLEIVPGVSARGYKNLTTNEWFFPVHFPEEPIMPGMIQMEALLQLLSLTVLTLEGQAGKVVSGMAANKILLKRRIVPGDRLDIEAELISFEQGIAVGKALGKVDGRVACSAEFKFYVSDNSNFPKAGDL